MKFQKIVKRLKIQSKQSKKIDAARREAKLRLANAPKILQVHSNDEIYRQKIDDYYNTTAKIIDDKGGIREIGYACSVLRDQGSFLYDIVREVQPKQSLEIGLAWGGSAIHILCALEANKSGQHTAIDPLQKGWSDIGVREPARLGLGHLIECLYEKSETVLPRFLVEGKTFQFIFIDGDHRFDAVMNDFFYSQKLLEVGGILVFDDAGGHAIDMVTRFVDKNMTNMELYFSPYNRFATYKKTGEDTREIGYAVPFAMPLI